MRNLGYFKNKNSSDAGKSSLLDILAGRKIGRGIRGSVTINGKPVTTETSSQYFAYVAQEDVFVATLTVWEALSFYTQLSLPGDFSADQRKARMKAVLQTMGLEKVTQSRVSCDTSCPLTESKSFSAP